MAINVASLQQQFSKVITENGIKATFSRLGARLGVGYVVLANSENKSGENLNDNVSKFCYLSNTVKFTPLTGDEVTINKDVWRIAYVKKYEPSGTAIAYKIGLE